MATVLIDEIEFYYELHGKGKPLVLISGYTCDHSIWNLMVKELAERFQVLLFDNRAVGQTKDDGQSFTLETMSEDTMKLIRKLGLQKPHILGQSMGGAIAQLIARNYSDDIDKLIILNSTSQFNSRTMQVCKSLLTALKMGVDLDLVVDLSMSWFFGAHFLENPQQRTEFKKLILANPYLPTIEDQERQLHALSSFNSSFWLEELKIPTQILFAQDDIITLPEEAKLLAEKIANAQLKSVKGGHSSPLEVYKQVNQLVKAFLTYN